MEITPGRAPFAEDEEYTPLRKPKSASGTPTHSSNAYNAPVASGISDTIAQTTLPNYGRTVSPSNLSPFAKEFVPRFGGNAATNVQERLVQQQKHQQQYNQQNYQQYQQLRQQQQQQQQMQPHQRVANGYQYGSRNYPQGMHQQQQHQQQQQQQQQQQYANQIASLNASVQERLKIGSGGGPGNSNKHASNNYHQQSSHQGGGRHNNKQHHQLQRYPPHSSTSRNQIAPTDSAMANGGGDSGPDVETVALEYLHTIIHCLNENPGQFDSVATRFLTIFDGMENNQYVLANAMEDIFQESIQNPNFRYMGAKLYNLLHMLNLKKDSLFHTLLKCKLDYHQQEVLQYMQTNQQHKVRETALFLAELYMQLRGDDSRIHLIAENIVYSLKQLLSKESIENIRCICLTLKLAGYDLTADCAESINQIISQLDAINVQSPGKYPLAANVISLQKNNWGRKISSSNSMSETELPKAPEPLRISDEPIFYGPDGRELTVEETDFLTGGASGVGSQSDEDEAGETDADFPDMDEETEKAYKEFCKLNSTT